MTQNISFLWNKPTDAGTWSGGDWVATGGLALANLATQDPTELARSTDADAANTRFAIDVGTAPVQPFSMFAMLNHNGTTAAQWRIFGSENADGSDPLFDTGLVNMWVPTVVFGALPWGAFPWDGVDQSAYPGGTVAFQTLAAPVYCPHLFVEVSDEANPAGYFQAGRFMAGQAWQPADNMSYGVRIRNVDPSTVRRTRGGKRVVRQRPGYRRLDASFEHLTEEEAMGVAFEIDRQIGKRGDFLVVYDADDHPSIRFRRTLYASLVDTSDIVTQEGRYVWTLAAEEIT